MINWLDPKSVIEHLRETEGVYLAAVIPTMADPIVGRFSSGETASPEVRRDGLHPNLLLMKGSGEYGDGPRPALPRLCSVDWSSLRLFGFGFQF